MRFQARIYYAKPKDCTTPFSHFVIAFVVKSWFVVKETSLLVTPASTVSLGRSSIF